MLVSGTISDGALKLETIRNSITFNLKHTFHFNLLMSGRVGTKLNIEERFVQFIEIAQFF